MRTDRTNWFLDLAERCARQGTCLRRNFGSIIVDTNSTIVSTGYTGAPCGQIDCLKRRTCWREQNNILSGSNYEKCYSVHSEANAIIQAGKNARGSTLYLSGIDAKTGENVSMIPCFMCAKMIINAGIISIVVRDKCDVFKTYRPQEVYDIQAAAAFGKLN